MEESVVVHAPDGTRLFVTRQGVPDKPAVLLCDGLGCDGFIWKYLAPALQRRYLVIHPHHRGHGKSDVPNTPAGIGVQAMRNDVLAVLDALGVPQAVIIGHSMGAQLAFDFALHHPQRVLGVVSLCGSYGRPLDTLRGGPTLGRLFALLQGSLSQFPLAIERLWRWFFRTDWSLAYARKFEANEKQLVEEDFRPYFEHLSRMDPHLFVALVNQLQKHSVLERLHELQMPTLIVAGEKDTFCPAALSERMHANAKRSTLVIVPNGSHVAPLEDPALVQEAVLAFLQRAFLVLAPPRAAAGLRRPT